MFTAVLLVAGCALLGLGLLGIAMLLWASWCAPEGREDERGFHLVNPKVPEEPAPPASPSASASAPVTDTAVPRMTPMR